VQVVVATITNDTDAYAADVLKALKAKGLRVEADLRFEKISYKVREHSLQKVPFILAVGAREMADGTVAVRRFGSDAQEVISLADCLNMLQSTCKAPN
jgi:threonyl-tRNA synthetase